MEIGSHKRRDRLHRHVAGRLGYTHRRLACTYAASHSHWEMWSGEKSWGSMHIHRQARKRLHRCRFSIYTRHRSTGSMHLKVSPVLGGCRIQTKSMVTPSGQGPRFHPRCSCFMLTTEMAPDFPYSTTSGGPSGDGHPQYTQSPNPIGGMG